MIKIIKHGTGFREITCKYCGCIFEFTDDEIKYDDEFFPRVVRCPDCNQWLSIPFHSTTN